MKQYSFLLIVLLTLFLLCGCAAQTQSETTGETNYQPASSPTEVTEEKNYPDMEEEVFALGFVTADSIASNTPCQIRTRKYRKDHPDYICYALYIEVDTGLQVLKTELEPETSPNPGGCGILFGDVNGDGISEILCKQYTPIRDHADYTGTACSVLKFNAKTQAVEVVDAWYEPNIEE